MTYLDDSKYQEPVSEWLRFVAENHALNINESREICTKIYQYANENKKEELLGFSLYYLGEADYIENNVDGLFSNITNALHYLTKTKQWERVARGYNMLGISSICRGNAPFAMDYYLNALTYCNLYKLDHIGMLVNMNVGTLYQILGEYAIAQKYFSIGASILKEMKEFPQYDSYLQNYYSSIGNSYISMGLLEEAKEYQRRAKAECQFIVGSLEMISFQVFSCRLAHKQGDFKERDFYIEELEGAINKEIELLSVFDDLFLYAELLFEIEKKNEFWKVVTTLEEMAKKSNIGHMQLQSLELKIKFMQKYQDMDSYKSLATEYYELSQIMKTEHQLMVKRMIQVRNYLEESQRVSEEMQQKNEILQKRSETDALTGLNNRFRLNTYAEEVFMKANRRRENVTIEILDIDHFKEYNDYYGHQAGDACIIKIAEEIKKMAVEENVFSARYGGDEFILIFENYSKEEVIAFAKKLRQNTMKLQIEHGKSPDTSIVTISQGICQDIPRKKNKVWDFLSTADNMLYRVKQFGRNNIAFGYLGAKDGEICVRE